MQRIPERCLGCVCTGMWSSLPVAAQRERRGECCSEMSAQLSAAMGDLSGTPVKQHLIFCSLSFCFINRKLTSLLSSKTSCTHSIFLYFFLKNQLANTIPLHPQQTKHLRQIFCIEGGTIPFLPGCGALFLSICWSLPELGLSAVQSWLSECCKTFP